MKEPNTNKNLIGSTILGVTNCFLGLAALINYLSLTPQDFEKVLALFKHKNLAINITFEQFKVYNIIPAMIALVFLASGIGLILKKNWARKITVYLSFALAFLIFLSILLSPAMIRFVILQVAYLGVLIIYFTNQNVENFFVSSKDTKKEN
ncbi:MAG: hypothetical protein KBB01_00010 [Candidatus Omnitrophica bacterium]|jgi:asparagine N-glycosylation enzyme membrane subunit Stt3|nr:hypothetical protein [Candidatus Omnitrophota bacterium]